jgi:hypothetical protein
MPFINPTFYSKHQGTCPTNGKEIQARGLQDAPNEQSDLVHFVLHLLLQQLIVLYFDIQEQFKQPGYHHQPGRFLPLRTESSAFRHSAAHFIAKRRIRKEFSTGHENPMPSKFTFGFNGNADNLTTVLGSYVPKDLTQ